MMTMQAPPRDASYFPTVKCSTCASNIDLAAVADHVCPAASIAETSPVREHNLVPSNHSQYEQQTGSALPFRNPRPVLSKIDSSISNRSGLRPSEAASIAYDLGLPSPLSAGSGHRQHRSRSKSRKASTPRPPSGDVPISQDCAFPPFPMKPKRTQPEKEARPHTSHTTHSKNRSMASTRTYEHASKGSVSSSIYSTSSGPTKRRTSNTSSSQRSRQGTIDDSMSLPSTAPSSPRQSTLPSLSREQSLEQQVPLPVLASSYSNTSSEPSSTTSSMPPTPSWPLETGEPPTRVVQSPSSDTGWTPTESTIPEEQLSEIEPLGHNRAISNKSETLDTILPPEHLRASSDMFDNPPREPLYKAKRPAPLLQPSRRVTDDPAMPLSARVTPTTTSQGGLARTLTNIFGRKRSQTSSGKVMPLPLVDSPRIRALAPDPPERPQRGESLWDDAIPNDEFVTVRSPSSPAKSMNDSVERNGLLPEVELNSSNTSYEENTTDKKALDNSAGFDFKFGSGDTLEEADKPIAGVAATTDPVQPPEPTDYTNAAPEESEQYLHRASIDSASSYGSIGFSNRTKSSRSSHPISDGNTYKIPSMPEADQPSIISTDMSAQPRQQKNELVPESPTDPLYSAGKLSPVPEVEALRWSPSAEPEKASKETSPSRTSELAPHETPKTNRPVTPGGVKGRCRGCSNLILMGQKSVASADGRLTGKYHKECFGCQTCKEPFATADFYVFNDQPYCAHDYHVINDTLCTGCGKGIEGQYFESFDVAGSSSKKFHPKCLQCSTCKIQLHEDYFEFHGRVYCERDAFRAASGPPRNPGDRTPSRPSPLVREYINSEEPGLKGRFPERRTTRLIMT